MSGVAHTPAVKHHLVKRYTVVGKASAGVLIDCHPNDMTIRLHDKMVTAHNYEALAEVADEAVAEMVELRATTAKLRAKRDELVAAIHEALDYFEDREDVVDGAYGEPAPNKEMSLARVLRDAIKGTT